MAWITAITDRTQSDVDRVKYLNAKGWNNLTPAEKTEWLNGLKGALNLSDLERIENNIGILSEVLELGLYTYSSIPYNLPESYFLNMLSNVATIRGAYCIHSDTPTTPEAPINTYQKVNDIERILYDVYSILMDNFDYYDTDDIYCDDTVGLLL